MGDYGIGPVEWNRRYEGYYSALRELGFSLVEPPAELLYSTRAHRWGMHPIHYQQSASLELVTQLLQRHQDTR